MIKITYTNDERPNNTDLTLTFDDVNGATYTDVLAGFVRMMRFATYNDASFDNIIAAAEKYKNEYGDSLAESVIQHALCVKED